MRRVGVGLVFRTIGVLRFGVGCELGARRDLMVVRAELASGVPQRRAMGRWWRGACLRTTRRDEDTGVRGKQADGVERESSSRFWFWRQLAVLQWARRPSVETSFRKRGARTERNGQQDGHRPRGISAVVQASKIAAT